MDIQNSFNWSYIERNNAYLGNVSLLKNSGNTSLSAPPEPPSYIVVVSTVLYCLTFLIGVTGNIIVVVVISVSRALKTTVNKYLMNLCVADLMVLLVCMPTALTEIYTKEVWYFGEFMCKFVPFLENTAANASVLTILTISFERYRVVCFPLKVITDKVDKIRRCVILIWIVSMVASAPWFWIAVQKSSMLTDGTPIAVCRNPIKATWHKVYIVGFSVAFFVLPSLIMMVLYCHLCQSLTRTQSTTCECGLSIVEQNRERRRKINQIANTIFSIVIIFFICQLPIRITVMWFSFEDKNVIWELGLEKFLLLLNSTRVMFYLGHALDPVVYNFVSSKFRRALGDACIRANCFNDTFGYSERIRQTNDTIRSHRPVTPQGFHTNNTNCINMKQLSRNQNSDAEEDGNRLSNLLLQVQRIPSKRIFYSSRRNEQSYSIKDEYSVSIQIKNKDIAIKLDMKEDLIKSDDEKA